MSRLTPLAIAGCATIAARRLARLIETRLLGVRPDDQDLVLEDSDWIIILKALRGKT